MKGTTEREREALIELVKREFEKALADAGYMPVAEYVEKNDRRR